MAKIEYLDKKKSYSLHSFSCIVADIKWGECGPVHSEYDFLIVIPQVDEFESCYKSWNSPV